MTLNSYDQLLLRQPISIYTAPWVAGNTIPGPNDALNQVVGSGATATATVAGGAVTAINVSDAGMDYVTPPTVMITGVGFGARATAVLNAAGGVASVTVDEGGAGYTTAPTIAFVSNDKMWTPIGESPAIEEIAGADGVTVRKPHGMDMLMGAKSLYPLAAARTEDKLEVELVCYDQRIAAIGFALDVDVTTAAGPPQVRTIPLTRPNRPRHYHLIARGVVAGESDSILGQYVLPKCVNTAPWEQVRSITKWAAHSLKLEAIGDLSIADATRRLGYLQELTA